MPSEVRAPRREGVGGSGGLDSIRTRILACIATRNYDQAREYLKLAANMADDEVARFEQIISAGERGLVPFLEKALPHIFKADPGHFAEDTAAARELIQTTVTSANFVGLSSKGNQVYARLLDTGAQIWVYVWNGTIRDGGRNDVPWSVAKLLK
jgi:hypothetical protein